MKHSVKHLLGAVFCWRTHWIRGGISHTRTPKAGPCTANQPSCRMPANACLLVLASLLPCAMPRAKSPPCLAAAAVRVLLLRAWVARSAPHQSWHRPLLCGRLPGCCSAPQQTQCTPTYTHKNRERDQTNPKRASELNQNRPLPRSRGGKGLLSHGSKVQFSIQKL